MKKFLEYVYITLGVLLVALATECFLAPNKIAAGGVTGIAIIVNNFFPILDVGALMLGMNIILFIVAFIVIGGKFGAKTIYSSLGLSGMIWILEKFFPGQLVITNDLMLASIFGTLMSGIGMGIVFNQNASTGGTDILAKILNKFVHMDIGKALLAVDFIVTLTAGITFGANIGLFALLCVIMNGFVIDYVIDGLNVSKEVFVISRENDKVKDFIMKELDRGCTMIQGKGGFTNEGSYIIYVVLQRREFIKLREYVRDIDNDAFITVSDTHEVLGNGFQDIWGE